MATLKSRNKLGLATALGANFALYFVLLRGSALLTAVSERKLHDIRGVLTAGGGILLTGLLNAQLSSTAKARLVFWRWRNPLPGSRAFSDIITTDPRIDAETLRKRYGPFPSDPVAQNKFWYKLYLTVQDRPPVADAHEEFLFARDYAGLIAIASVLLIPLAAVSLTSLAKGLALTAVLVVQYLAATRAARVHANRLVCTVLAIVSGDEVIGG